MKYLIAEAFRTAILTEKKSYDFYRKMAETVHEKRLSNFFSKLADEEAEHMKSFVLRYPGDEYDLLALVNCKTETEIEVPVSFFEASHDGSLDRQALEISLYEELLCLNYYSTFVSCIKEPELYSLFEAALDDTRKHFSQIYEEYLRVTDVEKTPAMPLNSVDQVHMLKTMPIPPYWD